MVIVHVLERALIVKADASAPQFITAQTSKLGPQRPGCITFRTLNFNRSKFNPKP